MKRTALILVALGLVVTLCTTSLRAQSALQLTEDYHLGDKIELPRPASITGLVIEPIEYPEHRATEWQVTLQAPEAGESPLIENLDSADFVVRFPSPERVSLHWSSGSHALPTDFQPHVESLKQGHTFSQESFGGRSSDGVMPYFNVATGSGGLIVAIGWAGDWRATFERQSETEIRIRAGLKRSRFRLSPGERVRLPSVLVMSYQGDWITGQNQFRKLILQSFTPRNHAPLDLMPVAASVHGMIGFNATTEENLTSLAANISALKLPLDTFWLDAGWNEGGFPAAQGNPLADPIRYPRGLSPVGKAVKEQGLRFLVWFEPERAMRGTWLDREHASWLLSPTDTPNALRYLEIDGFRLLDLGQPEARQWAIEQVSQQIRESEISIYRQDFNEYPAYFWQTQDSGDAIGLREVRYINGLYTFLDELVRRHPQLIIDNCASGGRRYDFEMIRRSVVLWRSDSCWDDPTYPRNVQAMTHGLSLWIPLHGLGSVSTDPRSLRSGMGACASFAANYYNSVATEQLREHLRLYLPVRSLFTQDYYPLTEWSDDPKVWLAFQYHNPETGAGIVQAFCGTNEPLAPLSLELRGLDPSRKYVVTDWDSPTTPIPKTGIELRDRGIEASPTSPTTARVWQYKLVP